mmetsp:Transcript_24976/g.36918  ORF Transcript_24976/g.36918 Transcript_24976/m.36918 type:complete len:145 (+) Transcript_24976:126-560(+)
MSLYSMIMFVNRASLSFTMKAQTNPFTLITNRSFASKKHKAVLRQSKGFRGRAKNCYTIAIRRLQKSWQYAYRDRKVQKREWRKLWIQRLNAGVRQYGISYSRFIPQLQQANIQLNRKVLAELAAKEPFSLKAVIDVTRHATQK